MTGRSATTQKVEFVKPQASGADSEKPRKIVALYLNPSCEHDWSKLDKELQTLEPEGKIIWKCGSCGEITNTYDWQTP